MNIHVKRLIFGFALFIVALISTLLWSNLCDLSVLTIERNLLSGIGIRIVDVSSETIFLLILFLILICIRKVSPWTRAGLYGCLSSISLSSVLIVIKHFKPSFTISKPVVFIGILLVSALFMFFSFLMTDYWIPPLKTKVGLAAGIIPFVICMIITMCTIFTITFEKTISDGHLVFALISGILLSGICIFLFFHFDIDYEVYIESKIPPQKAGNVYIYDSETNTFELLTAPNESQNEKEKPNTTEKKNDFTLNDDVMEQIRRKNKK